MNSRKNFIFIIIIVLIAAGGMATAYFLFFMEQPVNEEEYNELFDHVDILIAQSDHKEAGRILGRLAGQARTSTHWFRIIKRSRIIARRENNYALSTGFAQKAADVFPGNEEFHVLAAYFEGQNGQYEKAYKRSKDLLKSSEYDPVKTLSFLGANVPDSDEPLIGDELSRILYNLTTIEDPQLFSDLTTTLLNVYRDNGDEVIAYVVDAAILWMARGDVSQAFTKISTVSDVETARSVYALISYDSGNYSQAISVLEAVPTPTFTDKLLLADIYIHDKKLQAAKTVLLESILPRTISISLMEDIFFRLEAGDRRLVLQMYTGTEDGYVKTDTYEPAILQKLVNILIDLPVRIFPDDYLQPYINIMLCDYYIGNREIDEHPLYSRTMYLFNNRKDVVKFAAHMNYSKGNHADAKRILNEFNTYPDNKLLFMKYYQNDYSNKWGYRSLTQYSAALWTMYNRYPENEDVLSFLAYSMLKIRDKTGFEVLLDRENGVVRDPLVPYLAIYQYLIGEKDTAIETIMNTDKESAWFSHYNVGLMFKDKKEYIESRRQFDIANGMLSDAYPVLDRGKYLAMVLNQVGDIYLVNNDLRRARIKFNEVLELEPDNEFAKQKLASIQNITE